MTLTNYAALTNAAGNLPTGAILIMSRNFALLEKLKKLETENPDLIAPDSPTQRVGGRAEGFKPFVHRVPLMSLDNSYLFYTFDAADERSRIVADGRGFDYIAELSAS